MIVLVRTVTLGNYTFASLWHTNHAHQLLRCQFFWSDAFTYMVNLGALTHVLLAIIPLAS